MLGRVSVLQELCCGDLDRNPALIVLGIGVEDLAAVEQKLSGQGNCKFRPKILPLSLVTCLCVVVETVKSFNH